jgi:hypothetical protein
MLPPPRYFVTAAILSALAVGYENWPIASAADFTIIVAAAALLGGAFWGWFFWWSIEKRQ